MMAMKAMESDAAYAEAPFEEQALAEYRLYSLDRPVSLAPAEQKQILLLEAADVPVTRRHVTRSAGFMGPVGTGEPQPMPVETLLEFETGARSPVGRALPAGVVRIYEEDGAAFRLLGEDRIRHTPPGEPVSLRVGQASDLVAERRQMDFQQRPRGFEAAYEIRLRNRRQERAGIEARESLPGDWRILESSQPWTKRDASTIAFTADLPPGGEVIITYRIRVE